MIEKGILSKSSVAGKYREILLEACWALLRQFIVMSLEKHWKLRHAFAGERTRDIQTART